MKLEYHFQAKTLAQMFLLNCYSEGQPKVRVPLRRRALPLLHLQGQRRAGQAPLPAEAAAAPAARRVPGTVGTGERVTFRG